MTFLAWATFAEGPTDHEYLDVLIPRLMEDVVARDGVRPATIPLLPAVRLGQRSREIGSVAQEACHNRDAFHLLFVHSDTGGRELGKTIAQRTVAYIDASFERCGLRRDRCVVIAPRHETEAWALADPEAVAEALGYRGRLTKLGLPPKPAASERLVSPKETLSSVVNIVRGVQDRSGSAALAAIAQRQNLSLLRQMDSFAGFEEGLRSALRSLGILAAVPN